MNNTSKPLQERMSENCLKSKWILPPKKFSLVRL